VTCKECREAMVTDPLLNRLRCADCRSLRWSVFRKRAVRVGLIATGGLMAFLLAFHRYRRMCRQKHTSIRGGLALRGWTVRVQSVTGFRFTPSADPYRSIFSDTLYNLAR
jgi:hypothetical protein